MPIWSNKLIFFYVEVAFFHNSLTLPLSDPAKFLRNAQKVQIPSRWVPWSSTIWRIRAQYGPTAASCFNFIRWIILLNVISSILSLSLVGIPQVGVVNLIVNLILLGYKDENMVSCGYGAVCPRRQRRSARVYMPQFVLCTRLQDQ